MKTIMMALLALNLANGLTSQAQEICEECTMPPKSIGAGGLTCKKAEEAFKKAGGAKNVIESVYTGSISYALASEVYCVPHYGMATVDTSGVLLKFNSSEVEDVLSGEYVQSTTASIENIMGSPYLSSRNNPVAFNTAGDACFSRYQLVRDNYGRWNYPHQRHYFNYQCKVPQNQGALICKVKYDGIIDIGYQVYQMNGNQQSFPEGILE